MNQLDNFKIGLSELNSNKLRAFLTLLGIVFGIASVVTMLSISDGAKHESLKQIQLLGTNNIIIKNSQKKNTTGIKDTFSPGLTLNDISSIRQIVTSIKYIIPIKESSFRISYKSVLTEAKVIGTNCDYPKVFNSKIASGNFISILHLNDFSKVCVIGYGIKRKIFKYEDALNKKIKIGNQWFRIIGVISHKNYSSSISQEIGAVDFNNEIYIPYTTMVNNLETKILQNNSNISNRIDRTTLDQIIIKVKNIDLINQTRDIISRILRKRHSNILDYKIIIPEELLAQKQKIQKIFSIVMVTIASISLLVGGIGIMNIMLANILERKTEIGIRRAIGATKQNILMQFVYEAVFLSLLGGILGILLGIILTSIVSSYAGWYTSTTTISVFLALFVSISVGLIFGIFPANSAANKTPIEYLKYE